MTQKTTLMPTGTPGQLYGSFSGKAWGVATVSSGPVIRAGVVGLRIRAGVEVPDAEIRATVSAVPGMREGSEI